MDLSSSSLNLQEMTIYWIWYYLQINPDSIENIQVVPGISDHETITFQLVLPSVKPTTNNLRKVYQYHRADVRGISEKLSTFTTYFLANNPYGKTVESN